MVWVSVMWATLLRLRDKIEKAGYDPSLVETVRGYGYRFRQ